MHQPPSWRYGYEASGAAACYQLCLRHSRCRLDDPGLAEHCGGCNPACNADNPGITPADPDLDEILQNVGGLAFDIRGFACPARQIPRLVPLVWDNRQTMPDDLTSGLAVSPERVFRVREVRRRVHCTLDLSVRGTLRLPDNVPLWLAPGAPDEVLEWMWENPVETRSALASHRVAGMGAPHFSVDGDLCPLTWRVYL